MEVLRDSATIVRSWLGPCSFPTVCTPPALLLRPDRLGLGATPQVVAEETRTRYMIAERIEKKLKKACRVEKPTAVPKDGTDNSLNEDSGEEMSRSNAIKVLRSAPTERTYQGLGKRARKKYAMHPATAASSVMPNGELASRPDHTACTPSTHCDVTTPTDDKQFSSGGCGILEPVVSGSGDSTPNVSPSLVGDLNSDKWKAVGKSITDSSCERRDVGCNGAESSVPLSQGKMKLKQSFSFSFSLSRSPYSRVRDRSRLVRNGSRFRLRKSVCTK